MLTHLKSPKPFKTSGVDSKSKSRSGLTKKTNKKNQGSPVESESSLLSEGGSPTPFSSRPNRSIWRELLTFDFLILFLLSIFSNFSTRPNRSIWRELLRYAFNFLLFDFVSFIKFFQTFLQGRTDPSEESFWDMLLLLFDFVSFINFFFKLFFKAEQIHLKREIFQPFTPWFVSFINFC